MQLLPRSFTALASPNILFNLFDISLPMGVSHMAVLDGEKKCHGGSGGSVIRIGMSQGGRSPPIQPQLVGVHMTPLLVRLEPHSRLGSSVSP